MSDLFPDFSLVAIVVLEVVGRIFGFRAILGLAFIPGCYVGEPLGRAFCGLAENKHAPKTPQQVVRVVGGIFTLAFCMFALIIEGQMYERQHNLGRKVEGEAALPDGSQLSWWAVGIISIRIAIEGVVISAIVNGAFVLVKAAIRAFNESGRTREAISNDGFKARLA